ncbi:uncharacterized protein (DUF1800 family) [Sphingomonas vulcanisoli]|uniref:Uncharacterized protein (DUF1800 family) n=1 Tax=Sphingomonas vulcanisoli TaxID=1658060 RepID=A0ABX0TQP0_9SPHN|nr:DUF1800 family protein [Sphingomonas vulcanisoli]NIJ07746.1 uncharacterized protein (DUF1800 family) [Sphingomonas vulcanisoli]
MFFKRMRGPLAGGLACLALAACGGGGGGATPTTPDNGAAAAQAAATLKAQETDVSRLAKQATFGATQTLIDHIKSVGVSAWLDEQFSATGSTYADIAADKKQSGSAGFCATTDNQCNRHYFSREPVAMRFYADALGKPDQLRQRVALALSQLMVTSALEVPNAEGLAGYNQIFLDNAFGNFRDILGKVTLSGYMGDYLDMAGSNKNAPNENYAREMLQLFTMGPNKLNMDGTLVTDSTGAAVANYTADDVHNVALALTGWTYARFGAATDASFTDYAAAMVPNAAAYATTAKTFLGITIAAGASQTDSLNQTLDAAFNNASTPPYIAKYLIQQLVTSNPSAGYVGRVAAVFVNNGSNVRGDMKAVIKAILTDTEARGAAGSGDTYGKVKEPILLLTGVARAIGMTSDGFVLTQRDAALGQPVFQAPSVFNFYPPDFPLPESTTLVSPSSKLLSTGTYVLRSNLAYDWTVSTPALTRSEFNVNTAVTGATGTSIDMTSWEAFGTDIDSMIDRIDLLFANRTLTDAQKAALKSAATAVTNTNATTQARMRAQSMLYVMFSSPLYQVDR